MKELIGKITEIYREWTFYDTRFLRFAMEHDGETIFVNVPIVGAEPGKCAHITGEFRDIGFGKQFYGTGGDIITEDELDRLAKTVNHLRLRRYAKNFGVDKEEGKNVYQQFSSLPFDLKVKIISFALSEDAITLNSVEAQQKPEKETITAGLVGKGGQTSATVSEEGFVFSSGSELRDSFRPVEGFDEIDNRKRWDDLAYHGKTPKKATIWSEPVSLKTDKGPGRFRVCWEHTEGAYFYNKKLDRNFDDGVDKKPNKDIYTIYAFNESSGEYTDKVYATHLNNYKGTANVFGRDCFVFGEPPFRACVVFADNFEEKPVKVIEGLDAFVYEDHFFQVCFTETLNIKGRTCRTYNLYEYGQSGSQPVLAKNVADIKVRITESSPILETEKIPFIKTAFGWQLFPYGKGKIEQFVLPEMIKSYLETKEIAEWANGLSSAQLEQLINTFEFPDEGVDSRYDDAYTSLAQLLVPGWDDGLDEATRKEKLMRAFDSLHPQVKKDFLGKITRRLPGKKSRPAEAAMGKEQVQEDSARPVEAAMGASSDMSRKTDESDLGLNEKPASWQVLHYSGTLTREEIDSHPENLYVYADIVQNKYNKGHHADATAEAAEGAGNTLALRFIPLIPGNGQSLWTPELTDRSKPFVNSIWNQAHWYNLAQFREHCVRYLKDTRLRNIVLPDGEFLDKRFLLHIDESKAPQLASELKDILGAIKKAPEIWRAFHREHIIYETALKEYLLQHGGTYRFRHADSFWQSSGRRGDAPDEKVEEYDGMGYWKTGTGRFIRIFDIYLSDGKVRVNLTERIRKYRNNIVVAVGHFNAENIPLTEFAITQESSWNQPRSATEHMQHTEYEDYAGIEEDSCGYILSDFWEAVNKRGYDKYLTEEVNPIIEELKALSDDELLKRAGEATRRASAQVPAPAMYAGDRKMLCVFIGPDMKCKTEHGAPTKTKSYIDKCFGPETVQQIKDEGTPYTAILLSETLRDGTKETRKVILPKEGAWLVKAPYQDLLLSREDFARLMDRPSPGTCSLKPEFQEERESIVQPVAATKEEPFHRVDRDSFIKEMLKDVTDFEQQLDTVGRYEGYFTRKDEGGRTMYIICEGGENGSILCQDATRALSSLKERYDGAPLVMSDGDTSDTFTISDKELGELAFGRTIELRSNDGKYVSVAYSIKDDCIKPSISFEERQKARLLQAEAKAVKEQIARDPSQSKKEDKGQKR